jgi:hypothetical protein
VENLFNLGYDTTTLNQQTDFGVQFITKINVAGSHRAIRISACKVMNTF